MTIQQIEQKTGEAYRYYIYWLDYNHPVTGVSNTNIKTSYDNWMAWEDQLRAAQ